MKIRSVLRDTVSLASRTNVVVVVVAITRTRVLVEERGVTTDASLRASESMRSDNRSLRARWFERSLSTTASTIMLSVTFECRNAKISDHRNRNH